MEYSKILFEYINGRESYERKIGRYWASDLSSIIQGYMKPKDFGKSKSIDLLGCKRIITGEMAEGQARKIFEFSGIKFNESLFELVLRARAEVPETDKNKYTISSRDGQIKCVLYITDEIKLTVKPDFVFIDKVIETKFPFSMSELEAGKIPKRYTFQLEATYRAFGMPVQLGLLVVPFNLRIMDYKPSKVRWNNIKKKLVEFHEEVKKLNK